MWLKHVRSLGFGALKEGEALDFEPGLNVVYGRNEAGKSTWHTALLVGICGFRRKAGRPGPQQRAIERYQPWDGGHWGVALDICLEKNGYRISRDLVTGGCTVADLEFGAPYPRLKDLETEKVVDAAKLIGLDYRWFQAFACIGQADLLRLNGVSDGLQDLVERMTSTASADTTAEQAIRRLKDFAEGSVGTRIAPTRPLALAIVREEAANRALADARNRRDSYRGLREQIDERRRALADQERTAAALQAASLTLNVKALRVRHAAAASLIREFPAGEPGEPFDEALITCATTALSLWESRPAMPALDGESADDLARQIEELPEMPEGDLAVHISVANAYGELRTTTAALQTVNAQQPPTPEEPHRTIDSAGIAALAAELEAARSAPDVRPAARRAGKLWIAPLVLGIVLAAAGAALGIFSRPGGLLPGLIVCLFGFLLAAGALGYGIWSMRRAAPAQRSHSNPATVATIVAKIEALGLPADVLGLMHAASEQRGYEEALGRQQTWFEQYVRASEAVQIAGSALLTSLRARGEDVPEDIEPEVAYQEYVRRTAERDVVAGDAGERQLLEARLIARRDLEQRAADDLRAIRGRETAVRGIAGRILPALDPTLDITAIADALRNWLAHVEEERKAISRASQRWHDLRLASGGEDLESLDDALARAERLLAGTSGGIAPEEIDAYAADPDLAGRLALAIADRDRLRNESATLDGRLTEANLPEIAPLEENLAAATAEVERLARLRSLIDRTTGYLENAQKEAHRTIAPVLNTYVNQRIATITAGRYSAIQVDPRSNGGKSIEIRFADSRGSTHPAIELSFGTAEQLYLLLHLAMVEHMPATESVPIVLDDATVQFDRDRKSRVLDLLLNESTRRQILVFSQEEHVREWAIEHAPAVRLVNL